MSDAPLPADVAGHGDGPYLSPMTEITSRLSTALAEGDKIDGTLGEGAIVQDTKTTAGQQYCYIRRLFSWSQADPGERVPVAVLEEKAQ